ncbi:MAG: hypothetical protein ABSE84_21520 [Isosphaeraceae bacterium]
MAIDADDRQRGDLLGPGRVAVEARVPSREDGGQGRVELADPERPAVGSRQIVEPREEPRVQVLDVVRLERRAAVRPFDLLHVEADVQDLVADEEVVHLVGEVERRAGEDGDDVERDGVLSQPPDPLHDPAVRPQALAGLAERVVEEGRPVEADADPHGVRLDEVAPRLRDQRAIGLEGMVDGQAARVVRVDDRQGTLVERDRQDQGFPGMPDDGEAMLHKAAGKDALEDGVQHLGRHPLLRLPGRPEACLPGSCESGRPRRGKPHGIAVSSQAGPLVPK